MDRNKNLPKEENDKIIEYQGKNDISNWSVQKRGITK